MSKFRSFYPFDFQLLNENGEHALFIEDQTEKVTLSITNKGNIPLNFRVLNDQNPGAGYYHFKLHFRPGTLTSPENIKLNQENWLLAHSKFHGMDVLCFTLKDDVTPEALQIESGGELKLPMTEFSANRSTGSRETSVELISDHLYNKEDSQIIKATRLVKWPVINHRGNATLPVHVGFIGSDTILNNGEPNELTLRISLLHHKDRLKLIHSEDDSQRSKIIISFDEGAQEDEWTIADITTSHSFKFSTDSPYLSASKDEEGLPTLFTVSCSEKNVVMGRHVTNEPMDFDHIPNYFDIKIENIITNHPSGKTNCYVRFENIPGYWDNSFIVPIEKQPMIMRGDKVGIGKEPEASLDVKGDLIISEKALIKKSLTVGHWVEISDVLSVGGQISALGALFVTDKLSTGADAFIGGNLNIFQDTKIGGNIKTNGDIKSDGRIQDKTGDLMPVGAIIAYGGTEAPPGWELCNGNWAHVNGLKELHIALGSPPVRDVTWKNDGIVRSAFQLPDLRSRFIVGAGEGNGLSNYPINEKKGEEKHTLLISEMPEHSHEIKKVGQNGSSGNAHHTTIFIADGQTAKTGGDQPHNNLPPYYALTYIIKY